MRQRVHILLTHFLLTILFSFVNMAASVPANFDVVPKYHTIKSGETLESISKKYKVSKIFLKRWNTKQKNKGFKSGQIIIIGHVTELKDISKVVGKRVFAPVKEVPIYHRVKRGESLLDISEKFDEDITDLILWNDLYLTVNLRPDQKIIRGFSFQPDMNYIKELYNRPDIAKALGRQKEIPVASKPVKQATPPPPPKQTPPPPPIQPKTPRIVQTPRRLTPPPPPAPPRPAPVLYNNGNPNFIYHQMQAGETLYAIAGRYGVTINQLFQWNNIDAQKAFVPTGSPIIVGEVHQEQINRPEYNEQQLNPVENIVVNDNEATLSPKTEIVENNQPVIEDDPTLIEETDSLLVASDSTENLIGEDINSESEIPIDTTNYDSLMVASASVTDTPNKEQATEKADFPILIPNNQTNGTKINNPKKIPPNYRSLFEICQFIILTTVLSLIGIWLFVWGKRIFFPDKKTDQSSSKRQRTQSLLQKIALSYNHPKQATEDILAPFRSGSEIHLTQDALLQIFPSGFFLRAGNRKMCIEELVKIKQEQPHNTELFKAIYLLLDLEDDSLKKLRGTNIELQIKAIDELTQMEYSDALPEIQALMNHPQAGLRSQARIAMIELTPSDAHTLAFVNELQQPLTDWEQLHIMRFLKQRSKSQALPDFGNLIDTNKNWQSQFGLRMIAEFKQNSSIPDVLRLLHHEDIDIRRTAVETLGKLRNDIAVPTLKELYQQEQEDIIKQQIVQAMSNIATEEDIPFLEQSLLNKNYDISYQSAKTLIALGNKGRNSLINIKKQADERLLGIINRAQYQIAPN